MKSNLRQNLTQLCLSAWVLLALPATVQAQFNYTTNDSTITITGYTGLGGAVTIPDTINGLPVNRIGDNAFEDTRLTSVTIPNSVTNIGLFVFVNCFSLTVITVDTNNPVYSSVNGVLFDKSQTTLVEYPGGLGGSYTVPDSVTSIGEYAFYETALTSVTIPDSVTSIGDYAFAAYPFYPSSLTNVTIGSGVTNIGNYAFGYCYYLASVTIPNSVTSIGNGAFYECFSLKNVTIPNSVIGIGSNAFYQCSSLRRIYFTGNAPVADSSVFSLDYTTAYHLTNASGWSSTFAGIPTAVWNPTPPPTLSISQSSPGVITLSWKGDMVLIYSGSLDFNYPWFRAGDTSPVTAPIGLGNPSIFAEEPVGLDSQFFRLMDISDQWADFYANLYLTRNSYAPTSIRLQACKACAADYFLTAPFGDLWPNAYVEEALSIGYDIDPADPIVQNDIGLLRVIIYRTYGP